jgi:hypothetical protein
MTGLLKHYYLWCLYWGINKSRLNYKEPPVFRKFKKVVKKNGKKGKKGFLSKWARLLRFKKLKESKEWTLLISI